MLMAMAMMLSACDPPTPDPTPEPVGAAQTISFDTSNAAIQVGGSTVESAQTDENGNLVFTAVPVDNTMTLLWQESKPSLNITVNGNEFTITGATANATVSLIYWPKTPVGDPEVDSAFSGGNGSSSQPYVISNIGDLQQLAADVFGIPGDTGTSDYSNPYYEKFFKIDVNAANLNASTFEWLPIGGGAGPTSFQGFFDGSGKTIIGINYDHTEGDWSKGTSMKNNIGLFGKVEADASVSNLSIDDGEIAAQRGVGGIVGTSWGTIDNCHNLGVEVTFTETQGGGGIAGASRIDGIKTPPSTPVVSNCTNAAAVESTLPANPNPGPDGTKGGSAGGIVGENEGLLYNCSNTGTITSLWNAGGLVGANQNNIQQTKSTQGVTVVTLGYIANSYNAGAVTGAYAGGIVGYQFASAENVYNYGTVTGTSAAGEIIGELAVDTSDLTIVNDYLYYRTGTGALPVAGEETSGSYNGSESDGDFGYADPGELEYLLSLLDAWAVDAGSPYKRWIEGSDTHPTFL
jgi:hypothetical protein